jgi:hypothetical protein
MDTKNAPPEISAEDPGLKELMRTPAGRAYLDRAVKLFETHDRAADAPLPGPLRDAFAGEPVTVEIPRSIPGTDGSEAAVAIVKVALEPVSMWLVAILTRIGSPLFDVFRIIREELSRPVEGEPTPEEEAAARKLKWQAALDRIAADLKGAEIGTIETAFCFVHPVEELQKILDTEGRESFRDKALAELGKLNPVAFQKIQHAITQHYAASFSTVINHGDKPREGEVFTPPPAGRTTASAGGSASSAP